MFWQAKSIRFVVLVSGLFAPFAGGVAQTAQSRAGNPHLVEVFTTSRTPIAHDVDLSQLISGAIEIQLYELDGIQSVEVKLSQEVSGDPTQSKQVVLQRIQHLDEETRSRLQSASQGLVAAQHYDIDRLPAVVFDGQTVVYGVTDLPLALDYYEVWQAENRP